MQVRLITETIGTKGTEFEGKSIDDIIVGTARVSSSREVNELFADGYKLIRHCIIEGHWSVLEQANLGFQVITSRAVGREILRHEIKPQELSQRYAIATGFEDIELRIQDTKNRQMSGGLYEDEYMYFKFNENIKQTESLYREAIELGISKETARMILPECTQTVMNLNGNIRSWISFLSQRLHKTAQKEIRDVANGVKDIFIEKCPQISKALYNFEGACDISVFDRLVIEKHIKKGNVIRNF